MLPAVYFHKMWSVNWSHKGTLIIPYSRLGDDALFPLGSSGAASLLIVLSNFVTLLLSLRHLAETNSQWIHLSSIQLPGYKATNTLHLSHKLHILCTCVLRTSIFNRRQLTPGSRIRELSAPRTSSISSHTHPIPLSHLLASTPVDPRARLSTWFEMHP